MVFCVFGWSVKLIVSGRGVCNQNFDTREDDMHLQSKRPTKKRRNYSQVFLHSFFPFYFLLLFSSLTFFFFFFSQRSNEDYFARDFN